ncbi:hypothetical protein B0H17DRAFT_1198300 [Mycena rosella]|uniref:Uncharacterized protein n=1 Tax=Mycena rosella TaxID=1033263 RepID=A0AAD7DNG1_MYCRO|nr:hypothetical protein B0H17DRAFT_1198300 [Mycena rosella]
MEDKVRRIRSASASAFPSTSLADTSTAYDVDMEKGGCILPAPLSGSVPLEYMHNIELGMCSLSRPSLISMCPSMWPTLPSPVATGWCLHLFSYLCSVTPSVFLASRSFL